MAIVLKLKYLTINYGSQFSGSQECEIFKSNEIYTVLIAQVGYDAAGRSVIS